MGYGANLALGATVLIAVAVLDIQPWVVLVVLLEPGPQLPRQPLLPARPVPRFQKNLVF